MIDRKKEWDKIGQVCSAQSDTKVRDDNKLGHNILNILLKWILLNIVPIFTII